MVTPQEVTEDSAVIEVAELERLYQDDVYKLLRMKLHTEQNLTKIIHLNTLLEIRRDQIKKEEML